MSRGKAWRVKLKNLGDLATLIESMTSNQAFALGRLRADLPDEVAITTAENADSNPQPGVVARTTENLVFEAGVSALCLFDFDQKGMPQSVAERLAELGGFVPALISIMPALKNAERLIRKSTSAGLYRTDTGEKFQGSGGEHLYVVVADGADSPRFLSDLHKRCWLNGLGWMMVGRAGQLLDRSIVDASVASPERLIFEGPPIVVPPLAQQARKPIIT